MKRIEIGVGGLRQLASAFTRTWERTRSRQRLPEAPPRAVSRHPTPNWSFMLRCASRRKATAG